MNNVYLDTKFFNHIMHTFSFKNLLHNKPFSQTYFCSFLFKNLAKIGDKKLQEGSQKNTYVD